MTVRCSKPTDIPALYALWQEAFGDTTETIDLFFDTCFQPENTLVAEMDGKPVAVLYLLENVLQTENGCFSAAYIYAAATAKQYRQRGLMSALLQYAHHTAEEHEWDFLYLVPADENLFRYYGSRGFQTAFYKQKHQLSRSVLQALAAENADVLPDTPEIRFSVRASALQAVPHIVWQMPVLDFSKRLEYAFDVQSVFCENGFAVWEQEQDFAEVTEFCCADGSFPKTARLLLNASDAADFVLYTPVGLFPDTNETIPVGMVKPVSARAKQNPVQNAYLGITLG